MSNTYLAGKRTGEEIIRACDMVRNLEGDWFIQVEVGVTSPTQVKEILGYEVPYMTSESLTAVSANKIISNGSKEMLLTIYFNNLALVSKWRLKSIMGGKIDGDEKTAVSVKGVGIELYEFLNYVESLIDMGVEQ